MTVEDRKEMARAIREIVFKNLEQYKVARIKGTNKCMVFTSAGAWMSIPGIIEEDWMKVYPSAKAGRIVDSLWEKSHGDIEWLNRIPPGDL